MNHRRLARIGTLAAAIGLFLAPPAVEAQTPEPAGPEEYDVLTRGPVHEAFAESVNVRPEAGIIVATAPPEAIEELPPEVKPEGDNVVWISGYWMWDEDEADFLWVSGVWRNLPPGRQWVPGYWSDLGDDRWQWVAGYWADAAREEVSYVSTAPPESVEAGPVVEAPSADYSWIPGVWTWLETRYVWRPGYWLSFRPGWTWVPARYCWTPRGYVFLDGYWDHAVDYRGVLFAPIHFRHHTWRRAGFCYRPRIVVGLDVFRNHLFYRSRSCHYYFGDYYAPRYAGLGYNAAYAWHHRRGCYDPIYAYQRWNHRGDRGWGATHRQRYDYLRHHADARPPRTWAAMQRLDARANARANRRVFASTLADYSSVKRDRLRFQSLNEESRARIAGDRKRARDFRMQRARLEAGAPVARDAKKAVVRRARLANSPIVGRPLPKAQRANASRRTAVVPQARSARGQPQRQAAVPRAQRTTGPQTQRARTQAQRAQQPQRARAQQPQRARAQQPQRARAQQPQRARAQQPQRARSQQPSRAQPQPQRARPQPQQRARATQQQVRAAQQARAAQQRAQQAQRARSAQQQRARAQQAQRSRAAQQQRAQAQQMQRARAQQQRSRAQPVQRARVQQQRSRAAQPRRAQSQPQRSRAAQQRQDRRGRGR